LNPATKIILNVIGTFFVLLGILGAILPLLPATPFLLLASACYVRSSETLYRRLMTNKYLGPYILNFKDRRGLPRRIKIYTVLLLWASLLFSAYRLDTTALTLLLLTIGLGVSFLIFSTKTLKE
jgi:uncharacterized membrane protein YbaN (DUF454 family)